MKCFWKAHCVGDIEGGIALYQLAKLYEKANDSEQAAAAYQQYILDSEVDCAKIVIVQSSIVINFRPMESTIEISKAELTSFWPTIS